MLPPTHQRQRSLQQKQIHVARRRPPHPPSQIQTPQILPRMRMTRTERGKWSRRNGLRRNRLRKKRRRKKRRRRKRLTKRPRSKRRKRKKPEERRDPHPPQSAAVILPLQSEIHHHHHHHQDGCEKAAVERRMTREMNVVWKSAGRFVEIPQVLNGVRKLPHLLSSLRNGSPVLPRTQDLMQDHKNEW